MNPYQELPIYSSDVIRKYNGKSLGVLTPHVFAIGEHLLVLHYLVPFYSSPYFPPLPPLSYLLPILPSITTHSYLLPILPSITTHSYLLPILPSIATCLLRSPYLSNLTFGPLHHSHPSFVVLTISPLSNPREPLTCHLYVSLLHCCLCIPAPLLFVYPCSTVVCVSLLHCCLCIPAPLLFVYPCSTVVYVSLLHCCLCIPAPLLFMYPCSTVVCVSCSTVVYVSLLHCCLFIKNSESFPFTIYLIADKAYREMRSMKLSQSIIVSGK